MYKETRQKILVLQDINGITGIALTKDGWTSIGTKGFITVAIRYTDGWNLKYAILDTK